MSILDWEHRLGKRATRRWNPLPSIDRNPSHPKILCIRLLQIPFDFVRGSACTDGCRFAARIAGRRKLSSMALDPG